MGVTVRQKVKGRGKPWSVYVNDNGRRWSKKIGPKEEAEALAHKIREGLALKELAVGPLNGEIPTFGEYAREWLRGYGETNLKYSTWNGYRSLLENHLQAFLDQRLDQISRPDLKELVFAKQKSGLAAATVTRIKALVSSILSHALEDGHIMANPASGLGRHIKTKDRKADVNFLTREEARAFLEVVERHYPRHYPFFLCALRTGLRLGELLGLEWGDVDFRGGFIEVRRAHVKGRVTTPKSGKSRRVDMSPQLAETLKALQGERKREALAKGWGQVPERIFVNEVGEVLDEGNLRRRVFYPALAKAGLRRVRIHDLRHTFISLLIQNGESLAYVKEQAGHSSIQITVDIYGHLVPGANRAAVAKLDDACGPSGRVHLGASGGPQGA
jgi:integrase